MALESLQMLPNLQTRASRRKYEVDPAFELAEGPDGKASTSMSHSAIYSKSDPTKVIGMSVGYGGTSVFTTNPGAKSKKDQAMAIYKAFNSESSLPQHELSHLKIGVCGANYFNNYLLQMRYVVGGRTDLNDKNGLFADVDKATWYTQFQYERETSHGTRLVEETGAGSAPRHLDLQALQPTPQLARSQNDQAI